MSVELGLRILTHTRLFSAVLTYARKVLGAQTAARGERLSKRPRIRATRVHNPGETSEDPDYRTCP